MNTPFTYEDLQGLEEKQRQEEKQFCDTCVYENSCATLLSQNKMCEFKGLPHCNNIWGCTIHMNEEQYQEKLEAEEAIDEESQDVLA